MAKKIVYILSGFGVGVYPMLPLKKMIEQSGNIANFLPLPQNDNLARYFAPNLEFDNAVFMGWSLGGQIATLYALKYDMPLITLASNPCFIAEDDWPFGMDFKTFQDFCEQFDKNPEKTISRFTSLIAKGDTAPKILINEIREKIPVLDDNETIAARHQLNILDMLDTRKALKDLVRPQLHLFADNDCLINPKIIESMEEYAGKDAIELIDNSSHLLPYSHAGMIVDRLIDFIEQS